MRSVRPGSDSYLSVRENTYGRGGYQAVSNDLSLNGPAPSDDALREGRNGVPLAGLLYALIRVDLVRNQRAG